MHGVKAAASGKTEGTAVTEKAGELIVKRDDGGRKQVPSAQATSKRTWVRNAAVTAR